MANVDPENDPYNLTSVRVRLGGFHLLLSYLGAVGFIMAGSRLKEVFTETYAEKSVEKIFTGKAYATAIRGHFLVQTALSQLIFQAVDITDTEKALLQDLLQNLEDENTISELKKEEYLSIKNKFYNEINTIKERRPTS